MSEETFEYWYRALSVILLSGLVFVLFGILIPIIIKEAKDAFKK